MRKIGNEVNEKFSLSSINFMRIILDELNRLTQDSKNE